MPWAPRPSPDTDDDVEPPVPPGLGRLSASLESLAEFLRIDDDLLYVAAEASLPLEDARLDGNTVRAWVGTLPPADKDKLIANLVLDANHGPVSELLQRFLKERSTDGAGLAQTGRMAGQLLRAAEARTAERERIDAEKRAEAKARGERDAAIARKKHLHSLVGREPTLWVEVDTLIATKKPKSYDLALTLLVDLRDLDASGKGGDFGRRIEALRQSHASKPAFIKRLTQTGL